MTSVLSLTGTNEDTEIGHLDFPLMCQSGHVAENAICSVEVTHVAIVKCYGTYLVCAAHVANRHAHQSDNCSCGRRSRDCWSWIPIGGAA